MSEDKREQIKLEACPHCGHKLSPWQQVLLNVDRALTCKNCWYRILLDVFESDNPNKEDFNNDKSK